MVMQPRFLLREVEVRHLQLVVVDLRALVVVDARIADLVVDPRRHGVDDVLGLAVLVRAVLIVHEAEIEEVQRLRSFDGQLGADRLEAFEAFDVVAGVAAVLFDASAGRGRRAARASASSRSFASASRSLSVLIR